MLLKELSRNRSSFFFEINSIRFDYVIKSSMNSNRRVFLKSVGLLGVSTSIRTTKAQTIIPQTPIFQFLSPPHLQNFNKQTISIVAVFNKPAFAWVEILNDDDTVSQLIYQTEDGMRNANTEVFKFHVPHNNKDFKYRVVAKEVLKFEAYKIEYGTTIYSEIIQTQLPFIKDDESHVLILNDIHENPESYSLLYNSSSLPRKDLVLLNGDSFHYVTKVDDVINKLLKPITNSFASTTPFVLVRGNHETRGSFAREFKSYFDYPQNKFYQSFLLGSTYWIILDGGEDKPDSHPVYGQTVDYDAYRIEQKNWLADVLKSKERKKAKHTIIVNHIPWFHSDDWHGTLHNRACFHELVQKNKVDAVISGHTHRHGFYPPDQEHKYYVIIGGGPKVGERTIVEVSSHKNKLSIVLKNEKGEIINKLEKE